MSKPLFSLLLLSLLFMNSNSSTNSSSKICSPCHCGNGVNISYPFWLLDNTTSEQYYCGYRNFGLNCSADGKPILSLSNNAFYVENISYTDYTLTLVDIDLANQKCPRPRQNLTLDTVPLDYCPLDLNLTFYFNCTSAVSLSSADAIQCLESGANRSYVSVVESETDGVDWVGICEEKVVVTVKKDEIDVDDLISAIDGAVDKGFGLKWSTAEDCATCESSDGHCGYNDTAEELLCFCQGGTVSKNHCNGNGMNWHRKIAIGFGALGAGILLTCAAFFFCLRRNKKSYASSYLSRNISSEPSSSMTDVENMGRYFGVNIFTYNELEEATNNFDSSKELGDGGFGTVYYGKLRDGRVVAVKRLYENNYKRVEQFMNEVEILTRLRHQNLVALYGCTSRHSRELLLVYEYIPNGTVADHLHGERAKPGSVPWSIRMNIAIETACALTYLHASDIIHRDVKTNNILLDNNFCVKVADFGLSRLFPNDVTHISTAPQGTPGYVDPEYHQCYQLTDRSDVYSFGVVLMELISSMPAVDISRHRHEINLSNMAINKIQNHALHELVDPYLGFESDNKVRKMISAVAELAFQCLQNEKEMRPSMEEVLEVLKDIQSKVHNNEEKAEEVLDIPGDNVVLLKSCPLPYSPNSVTATWISTSTTPNASG